MPIIVCEKGIAAAQVVEKSTFGNEDDLQGYIHQHPEAIPVYDIQRDKRLLVLAREFETPSGPIDALAVDTDGDIYIVETKLYQNTDKRRVVAQVLDYGASLWKHFSDFAKFIQGLDQHAQKQWGVNARDRIKEFFSLEDDRIEDLIGNMRDNLNTGNLKFVVVMDSVEDRLKELITYVNQKSQFDIYGVELDLYRHKDQEIVIPKLYGMEVRKDNPPPAKPPLTEEKLRHLIRERNIPAIADLAELLLSRLKALGLCVKPWPSCLSFGLSIDGDFITLVSLTATNVWFALPRRAVHTLGEERFQDCKKRINAFGRFYGYGPRYEILNEKLDGFLDAIREIAADVETAMAE